MGITRCPIRLAAEDPFRPARIYRTLISAKRLTVRPRHPLAGFSSYFGCVFLQLCQIVKRVGTAQLALSKAYAGAFAVRITTQKPRASNPFTHFSIRRRIVSGES